MKPLQDSSPLQPHSQNTLPQKTKPQKTTPQKNLRIATRQSQLALWQARWLETVLQALGYTTTLLLVETQGDRDKTSPFAQLSGQGFFTKAVQDALLEGRADIAVHSHKDLPSQPVPGLEIAALSPRADARDVLLVRPEAYVAAAQREALHEALPLKLGASVGTSAVRRQRQLTCLRPDVVVRELRGNVPTRIARLRQGDYDAIVLAAAGVARLAPTLSDVVMHPLPVEVMVPAPAQGVLAMEIRRDDYNVASLLTEVHQKDVQAQVAAERGLMAMLQGGCQLALGAHATYLPQEKMLCLRAWYEGNYQEVRHPSAQGCAMLAYEALGRPSPA